MRKRTIIIFVIMVFILPQLVFQIVMRPGKLKRTAEITEVVNTNAAITIDMSQTIYVKDHERIMPMTVDEYVTGVVLGEMPADFEIEALKAQAVAARTFALRNAQQNRKHQDADVCTDSACCQAFILPSNYSGTEINLNKVRSAVIDTTGQVITYKGNLIEAVYFSSSGGQTEDALAVWGSDVPYLQSVSSPGEETAKNYEVTTMVSYEEFLKKLGLPVDAVFTNDDIVLTHTEGGGVEMFHLGKTSYSGVEMRSLFNLRSTMFSVQIDNTHISITTKGYGHRVGMSQYGAEAMAVKGCSYEQILMHYYSDTELSTLSQDQINTIFDKAEII